MSDRTSFFHPARFALFLFTFACLRVFAQPAGCGFDLFWQQQLKDDPSFRGQADAIDQLLYQHAQHPEQRSAQTTLYIPVVVHVIHNNGPENLTNTQVLAGIDELNKRFSNTAPYNDPAGVNVGIQFCVATVDPYGNPTNGITRNVSPLTDLSTPGATDLAMKNLNRWDPYLYFNIWIIKYTGSSTVAGYATFPNAAGSGIDGAVLQYNYFNSSATAHEAGHYLGLYHTFQDGCVNNNCQLNGDRICDTPPDATSTFNCPMNSCSTEMNDTSGFNPFTSDVMDSPNYMDYTNCPLLFTQGQSDRMNDVLATYRAVLLQSNGCGAHPGGPVPVASFTAGPTCGGTLLTNTSVNGVGAQWDLNGDGSIDNSGNLFVFNAPATGYYTVTIYAAGIGGTDTLTQTIFAQHYPYQNYPLVNGFSGISISMGGRVTICQGSIVTFYGEPGMAHYYWSNGDTTQNTSFAADTNAIHITLVTTDSAGLTWSSCYPINAVPVPATINPTITLLDSAACIWYPLDMAFTYSPIWWYGDLWSPTGTIQGFHNATYSPIADLSNIYWVNQTDTNGCSSSSNVINEMGYNSPQQGYISQSSGTLSYGAGMNWQWYLNGVPIPGATSSSYTPQLPGCYKCLAWWPGAQRCGTFSLDSVCMVSVGEFAVIDQVVLSPNPFSETMTLSFPEAQQNVTVRILDAAGRELKAIRFSGSTLTIERGEMSSGMYVFEVTDERGHVINRKIVVE